MKKTLLSIAFALTVIFSLAQNTYNVVVFSGDAEPFYAYVNGIRQNDKPETNIRVTDLNSEALSIRIQFENKALPVLKQNMMPEFGYEHTINIRKNIKKVMKLQYFGKVALAQAPRTAAATVQYHTAENPVNIISSGSITEETNTIPSSQNTHTALTVQAPESMDINIQPVTVVESSSTTSVITTTSNHNPRAPKRKSQNGNSTVTTTSVITTHTVRPAGNVVVYPTSTTTTSALSGSIIPRPMNPALMTGQTPSINATNCTTPIDDASYEKMKTSIDDTPFQDSKMSVAKVAVKNNCVSVNQVKGICELFGTDDHKLMFAKYAYNYCVDKANYYQVSEVFSFSRTTKDLNKFLEQK